MIKFCATENIITQVAIDSAGNLYVTDTHNHTIQKFNSNGQFILKLKVLVMDNWSAIGQWSGRAYIVSGTTYYKTVLEIGRRIRNSTTWFAASCPLDGLTARLLGVI